MPDQYVLDEDSIGGFRPLLDIGPRWTELAHSVSRSRGFIIIPGESFHTAQIKIAADYRLRAQVLAGVENVSEDGLDLQVDMKFSSGKTLRVATLHLENALKSGVPADIEVDLSAWANHEAEFVVSCGPGAEHDPRGDWLAIIGFAVARADKLPRAFASCQHRWRTENEMSRFDTYYSDPLYASRGGSADRANNDATFPIKVLPIPPSGEAAGVAPRLKADCLAALDPGAGENAMQYAQRALAHLIGPPPISFASRLAQIAAKHRPRVLSLCSGEAGIEETLLRTAGVSIDLTLLDINPILLQRAGRRMPPDTSVTLLQGTAENLAGLSDRFDLALMVSGLHHVVDLERVLAGVASRLVTDGELWLIGEQIGRNGGRLPADAYAHAAPLFDALPAELRWNASRGHLDNALPNGDFSSSCFEGIRAGDILLTVRRWFMPLHEDTRNVFLWRFVDHAYYRNYDLTRGDHLAALRNLVISDALFWQSGGHGSELNGIYMPKKFSEIGN